MGPSLESWIAWILTYSKEVIEFTTITLNSRLLPGTGKSTSIFWGVGGGGRETHPVVRPCPEKWSSYKDSSEKMRGKER